MYKTQIYMCSFCSKKELYLKVKPPRRSFVTLFFILCSFSLPKWMQDVGEDNNYKTKMNESSLCMKKQPELRFESYYKLFLLAPNFQTCQGFYTE